MSDHPWSIAIDAVNNDPQILSVDEAKGIILAHENANRRALQELHALLPELMAQGELPESAHKKITKVVMRAMRQDMPDLG